MVVIFVRTQPVISQSRFLEHTNVSLYDIVKEEGKSALVKIITNKGVTISVLPYIIFVITLKLREKKITDTFKS